MTNNKMLLKSLLCGFLVIVLFWMGSITVASASENRRNTGYLIDITSGLLSQRDAGSTMDLTETYFQNECPDSFDERYISMFAFWMALREATTIYDQSRNIINGQPIITAMAARNQYNEYFSIYFSREEYFVFIDYILAYAGVSRDEVGTIGIMEPMRFLTYIVPYHLSPLYGYLLCPIEYHGYDFFSCVETFETCNAIFPSSVSLFMGDQIRIHVAGIGFATATVGHPTNNTGRFFYTANHGIIPAGSNVYWGNTPVGVVRSPLFMPSSGIDVSRVELFSGFRVEPLIRGVTPITTFYGSRPTRPTPVSFTGATSGFVSGTVYSHSMDFIVGGIVMRMMIIATTVAGYHDSGAALVNGSMTVGTLSAGGRLIPGGPGPEVTAFSSGTVYRFFN